ncbi:MAG: hypothetical protein ACRDLK_10065 [Gaiellaceae bacterium]
MRRWFADYDALVTPTLTPVPIGTWAGKGWVRTMLGVGNWTYTVPWNLARLPAEEARFKRPAGTAGLARTPTGEKPITTPAK